MLDSQDSGLNARKTSPGFNHGEGNLQIKGVKIARPTKAQICADIAVALGTPAPGSSTGSSIDSAFLDAIHVALTGRPSGGSDTYRKTERVLQRLGLTYDPYWDTSEAAPDGGGTVTTRAFSRIRSAITGVPRCFILNTTDAPVGAKWETDLETIYRYDETASGRMPFNDAGPGSRVVHYSTSKSSGHPQHFVSHAEIHYIAAGWTGPWEARLSGYEALRAPVPVTDIDIPGWNRQNAITEVTWETYRALVQAGGVQLDAVAESITQDAGGDVVAERVSLDFPSPSKAPVIHVPDTLPAGTMSGPEPKQPTYEDSSSGVKSEGAPPSGARTPAEQKRDKVAEQRAVELAIAAIEADGWVLSADRQADGVGYDLEFTSNDRLLKVEVKGIQGRALAFNLTPKEWWRAETDSDWIVVAVSSVLSPKDFRLHLLTRDQIVEGSRVVTGYRLTF